MLVKSHVAYDICLDIGERIGQFLVQKEVTVQLLDHIPEPSPNTAAAPSPIVLFSLVSPFALKPMKSSARSCAYTLAIRENATLMPNSFLAIPTGVALNLPPGIHALILNKNENAEMGFATFEQVLFGENR